MAVVAALAAMPRPGNAQSLTSGALQGRVRDAEGSPLPGANVTVIDPAAGNRWSRVTRRDGGFDFPLVLPGTYDLLVERFGYRPRLVAGVRVRPGGVMTLDQELTAAAAGAITVDTVAYGGAPIGGSRLEFTGPTADLVGIAAPFGLLSDAGAVLAPVSDDLEAEGAPGSRTNVALEGLPRTAPQHPAIPGASLATLAFPIEGERSVELLLGGYDAEWQGGSGGFLSGVGLPGGLRTGIRAWAMGGADGARGGMVVSGPVPGDTARFALGLAVRDVTLPRPAPWGDGTGLTDTLDAAADSVATALVRIAQDSFQTDMNAYRAPYDERAQIVTGFGRLDWRVGRDHVLSVRASASAADLGVPDLGPTTAPVLTGDLEARAAAFAAVLTSTVTQKFGTELRAAVDIGRHDYLDAGLPGTVVDGRFAAGTDVRQPGLFDRRAVRLSLTSVWQTSRTLTLKFGLAGGYHSADMTYAEGRAGSFHFADTVGFAARRGVFRQQVGTSPVAGVQSTSWAFFTQALLRPSDGLALLFGLRFDNENLPTDQIRLNTAWRDLTGIVNSAVPSSASRVSPRAAVLWSAGARRQWLLHAEAGTFTDPMDPGLFGEAIVRSTGTQMRRGIGALGAWPQLPDSVAAPVQGVAMTLFSPFYVPPKTSRLSAGITGNMGGLVVRVKGLYRHTDYLTQRRDLNLVPDPLARDQDGRPLRGALVQEGSLLAAQPGTNRRFTGFDEVVSLDPSGFADHWAFTVGLEREVSRGLTLTASYTYSRTTDNTPGARAGTGEAQLLPFPDSGGSQEPARGRSDFDVPHRLALGAAWRSGGRANFRLAALLRYRSGYPYTPGFRDGVDANADGSAVNDAAFISDTLAGAAELVAAQSCLRTQVGRFAERNSCRESAASRLDLRAGLDLVQGRRLTVALVADAIGVVASDVGSVDRAFALVDAGRTLSTNAATRVTTVPLVANPNFGRLLATRNTGALYRFGVEVAF